MTASKFLKMIEAYYGKYERLTVKETVFDYLGQFREAELEILYQRLILDYSGQYKFTPDVAVLEDVKKRINEEQWHKVSGNLIGTNRRRLGIISEEKKNADMLNRILTGRA